MSGAEESDTPDKGEYKVLGIPEILKLTRQIGRASFPSVKRPLLISCKAAQEQELSRAIISCGCKKMHSAADKPPPKEHVVCVVGEVISADLVYPVRSRFAPAILFADSLAR